MNVRAVGYRIVRPNEQVEVSQAQQRRARRWTRQALQTVTHVAIDHLDPNEVARLMTEQARVAIQVCMDEENRAHTRPAKTGGAQAPIRTSVGGLYEKAPLDCDSP